MEEVIKIVHKNYEKITDDIMWLSNSWMLKFSVILNKYDNNNQKQNYHKEVGYYKNNDFCININRSFDYYLLIESVEKGSDGKKESIIIRQKDMYLLKFKLNQAAEWFTAQHNQGLFAKKDGKVFMPSRITPIRMTGLSYNKYIEFEPSILNYDNNEQDIGIRIYINSDVNSLFMEVSRFLAFKDFIDNFNMYQSAQLMINYLQRPEYGTNIYNINNKSQKRKFLER